MYPFSGTVLILFDTTIYDQLFLRCSAGDFNTTKSLFARLENDQSLPIPLQALAVLAARQGHADILEFCLQKGAELDEDVDMSAGQAVDSAEMIELLWNKNWRNIQQSEKIQQGMVMRSIHRPVGMLEFLVRHGAKIPSQLFGFPSLGQVSLPVMKTLVGECGIDPLRGTAALTLAVEEGNRDLVEYLCELGLPLNEVPPELDPREPGMCSPLYTAVRKRDISMMELLLEHGADPHAPYADHHQNSVLHAVQQRNDKDLLSVLEKYAAAKPSSQKI
jgi:hypothetical protein